MAYRTRIADEQLRRLLALHGAVKIEGARAVGKTTTAAQHATTIFRLEQADTLARVADDPDVLLRAEPPVLIDEWHLYPECMNIVKNAVDEQRVPGRFILTGSPAEPPMPKVHSGLGRIVPLYMRPMSLAERGTDAPTVSMKDLLTGKSAPIRGMTDVGKFGYAQAVLQSGFPDCIGEPFEIMSTSKTARLRHEPPLTSTRIS